MQDEDGHVQSGTLGAKHVTHHLKTLQKYYACRAKRFATRYETHLNDPNGKRGYAIWFVKYPRAAPFADLTTSTAIEPWRGRLRPVWTLAQRRRHTLNNGNPCYAFGKKHSNGTLVRQCGTVQLSSLHSLVFANINSKLDDLRKLQNLTPSRWHIGSLTPVPPIPYISTQICSNPWSN